MKEDFFIDTWGWVTLLNKQEEMHERVKFFYKDLRNQGKTIHTTDYVLDETFTLLFRRLSFSVAAKSISFINDAITDGYLLMEWITSDRFNKAKELRLQFKDKPKLSFTDITTIVVMKELDCKLILTDDDHFIPVGMGFEILK